MFFGRMLGSVPFSFAVLCVVMVSRAHAAGPVTLRWSAPTDCPTESEVLEEVNRLLGARTAPDDRRFEVVADVTRKDDGTYVVRLEIPAADGPRLRKVSAVSCAALGQATALILAMMVDPEAALTAPPLPARPPETTPGQTARQQGDPGQTLPKEQPTETTVPALAAFDRASGPVPSKGPVISSLLKKYPEDRRPSLSFALHLLGDVGSLPGAALGVGGAFGIFPGRLRFELGAAHFFERTGFFPAMPKAGTNANLWSFHASGGWAIMIHPKIEFTPRIRIEVGRMYASSFGVSDTDEGTGISVGIGVGGLLSVKLSRYAHVGLGLDGVALPAYPRFIVTGVVGGVHEPSFIVGRLTLEAAWRF